MTTREQTISFCLLAVLAVIVSAVLWVQGRYDPSQWRLQPDAQEVAVGALASPAEDGSHPMDRVAGLRPLTDRETYSAETLSDKINGKAELYLSAGFKNLQARRFATEDDASVWMERYVYDMGGYRNAYAVFAAQRRSAAQPLSLTPDGYVAGNGLFLVHGHYYLEIIAAQDADAVISAATDLAAAFVRSHDVENQVLEEVDYFPVQDQEPGSYSVVAEHAFGIDGFNWVHTALYKRDEDEATAFIHKSSNADEASERARIFADYFLEYGGETVFWEGLPAHTRMITIMDVYEAVLQHGPYIIGVHEATAPDLASDVLTAIHRRIANDRAD
jgi:hypothetical protein